MRGIVVVSVVLSALALPAVARPQFDTVVSPGDVRDVKDDQRAQGASDDRPVLLPLPVAAELELVPAQAEPAAASERRPVRRMLVVPWQTGVFQ